MKKMSLARKVTFSAVACVVLFICFAVVSSAVLTTSRFWESENVQIWLNDEEPIISGEGIFFEPGMNYTKDFELRNDGKTILSYRLYFDNVDGGLADVVEVTIRDGEKVLYQGTINELNKYDTRNAEEGIRPRETKVLTISFDYPKYAGMPDLGTYATFDLWAVGVPHAGAGGDNLVDQYVSEVDAAETVVNP